MGNKITNAFQQIQRKGVYEKIFLQAYPNVTFETCSVKNNWQIVRTVKQMVRASGCVFENVENVGENLEYSANLFGCDATVSVYELKNKCADLELDDQGKYVQ